MDQIMRQRDPALKETVDASLAGDIARAFEKLGDNVAEVNPDNLAGAAAARWLALPPEARERTGLMAPSHALREGINEIVRERLTRDGIVHGPAMTTERLASRGYTNAEKALARNYMRSTPRVRKRVRCRAASRRSPRTTACTAASACGISLPKSHFLDSQPLCPS